MKQTECQKKPPCVECGARNYDAGRFHAVYGLCVYCFPLPAARRQAGDRWRCQQVDSRPVDCPTDAPPGSIEKAERIAWRLANGLQLHHPDDMTLRRYYDELEAEEEDDPDLWQPDADAFEPETEKPARRPLTRRHRIRPTVDPLPVGAYHRWVELDTTRGKIRYRARPRWRGVKVNLGTYATHAAAVAAIADFEQSTSLPVDLPTRLPLAVAVVRLPDCWHAVDMPAGIPPTVARSAARRLAVAYASRETVARAYGRLLAAELTADGKRVDCGSGRLETRPTGKRKRGKD